MLNRRPFSLTSSAVSALALVAVIFLTLPIGALVLRAVETRGWEGAANTAIADAIWLSFVSTLISLILTLIFGTALAYRLARHEFRFKRLVSVLIELPIVMPPAVAGLALLITFGRRGLAGQPLADLGITLPFTLSAVVMAQVFVSAPFYIRAAQIGFRGVPDEIEASARVDGAAGWSLFRHITLPLASPALASGLILSWARALGEFGATILFAGSLQGRTQTMPLLIYTIIERDINAAIFTGVLLIGLALVALMASQWVLRRTPTEQVE